VDSQLSPEVVEAFTAATVTAFQELAGTEVMPAGTSPAEGGDVISTITLRRPTLGRLSLSFPLGVLEALAKRYLPDGVALSTEIIDDVAGEFANVIAGQAKTMLKGSPYHFTLSTPRVVRTASDEGTGTTALPFVCDAGAFVLRVELAACPGEC
jgi:CheY-specific phosphatase CheX